MQVVPKRCSFVFQGGPTIQKIIVLQISCGTGVLALCKGDEHTGLKFVFPEKTSGWIAFIHSQRLVLDQENLIEERGTWNSISVYFWKPFRVELLLNAAFLAAEVSGRCGHHLSGEVKPTWTVLSGTERFKDHSSDVMWSVSFHSNLSETDRGSHQEPSSNPGPLWQSST